MQIPFSESFLQHIKTVNAGNSPSYEYFQNLLAGLVNNVIPPLHGKAGMSAPAADGLPPSRLGSNKGQATATANTAEVNKAFYLHQDPGSYNQLLLETAVVELLSLPPPPNQIVAMLIHIAVRLPTSVPVGAPKTPCSPSAGGGENANAPGLNPSSAQSIPSPLMIQACGLLLAQLPTAFHAAIYTETARIMKKEWWLTDTSKQSGDLNAVFGYSTWDPSWGVQDETATVIGDSLSSESSLEYTKMLAFNFTYCRVWSYFS